MIFISHALEEALTHADRITVLRNGRLMVTGPAADFDRASLIRHMIGGGPCEQRSARGRRGARRASAAPVLGSRTSAWARWSTTCRSPIFPGEITGIAGLIGSGRSEVAKVIMGHTKRNFGGGRIWLNGREVRYALAGAGGGGRRRLCQRGSQARRLLRDAGRIREHRARMARQVRPQARWSRRWRKMRRLAERVGRAAVDPTAGADQPALHLSGGNQQKVVIAKSLAQEPRLVIFDEPTRGVDVGAVAEIRQIIRDFADCGAGVMVISSYLPEILDLSDRILVAKSGTIAAEFSRSEASAGEDPAGGDPLRKAQAVASAWAVAPSFAEASTSERRPFARIDKASREREWCLRVF